MVSHLQFHKLITINYFVFFIIQELLQHSDDGKVMACLVDKKEMMESEKCRAGITHFQLVSTPYHGSILVNVCLLYTN